MATRLAVLLSLPLTASVSLFAADPPGFNLWKAQDLKAFRTAKMLGDYGHHNVRMNHRDRDGEVEVHQNWIDVMVIESGEASLETGGTLVNPSVGEGGEIRAASATGGQAVTPLRPGDIAHIPQGVPHRFLVAPNKTVDYFALKIPTVTPVNPPGDAANFAVWKTADLHTRDGRLSGKLQADHSARETLGEYGSHRARLLYRVADGAPEQHDKIVDLWIVQSGEGTLVVGGKMTGAKPSAGEGEFLGIGIEGGERHAIAAGDIVHIPAGIPHSFLVPQGKHVTYVLLKIPAV